MQWSSETLAWALQGANLPRSEIATGVALALRISSGDDAWSWHPSPVAPVIYVGAWGLPMRIDDASYKDLHMSLIEQANRVTQRFLTDGNGWSWTLVTPEAAMSQHRDEAQQAAKSPKGYINSVLPISTDSIPSREALRVAALDLRHTLHSAGEFMRTLWADIRSRTHL